MQILNEAKKRELSARLDKFPKQTLTNEVRKLEYLLQFEDLRNSILYDTAITILYLLKDACVAKLEIDD